MPAPVSVQLYSLRKEAERDFPAVIARLGEIGFVGVEPAGFHGLGPGEFRRQVEATGMVVSSAHAPLPLGEDANRILDAQQALGHEHLIVPFMPPERFGTRDEVLRVAEELNRAQPAVSARGMRLGYHNHWWEFGQEIEGRSAHELLFEALAPEIFAEVDTYWAQVGGCDPAQVVAKLGARARLLHLKDGPADGPDSAMTAVGSGTLDVAAIAAANSEVEWQVVELDRCDGDMFEAIEQSYRYLTGQGLARGRV